ncbi:MAG: HU family DNA-binding protein [Succinivibrionaceae bacterium]|nr:HU family DNA-binding protein [Ruminobacter sp.]MDY5780194.1 HU family DNA-binding protein [Succinivibrionaceae bacterium]MEE1339365.1 HU family DNA-binding protein [Succinivibrionaceae bacterium]
MTKNELVELIAQKSGLKRKDAEASLAAFVETINETLVKGEDVALIGFGSFGVRERKAREGRNPRTGETITIKASKLPYFRAGKKLRDSLNA